MMRQGIQKLRCICAIRWVLVFALMYESSRGNVQLKGVFICSPCETLATDTRVGYL